jgi:hypothetical protein
MKQALKWVGIVLGVIAVLLGGFYGWAAAERNSILERDVTAHEVDFPVPFPLTPAEIAALRRDRAAAMAREAGVENADEDGAGEGEAGEGFFQLRTGSYGFRIDLTGSNSRSKNSFPAFLRWLQIFS